MNKVTTFVCSLIVCVLLIGCTPNSDVTGDFAKLNAALQIEVPAYVGASEYNLYQQASGTSNSWNSNISIRNGAIERFELTQTVRQDEEITTTSSSLNDVKAEKRPFNPDAVIKKQLLEDFAKLKIEGIESGGQPWTYDSQTKCYTALSMVSLSNNGFTPVSQVVCFNEKGLIEYAEWHVNGRKVRNTYDGTTQIEYQADSLTYTYNPPQEVAISEKVSKPSTTPKPEESVNPPASGPIKDLLVMLDTSTTSYQGQGILVYTERAPGRHSSGFQISTSTNTSAYDSNISKFSRFEMPDVWGAGGNDYNITASELVNGTICTTQAPLYQPEVATRLCTNESAPNLDLQTRQAIKEYVIAQAINQWSHDNQSNCYSAHANGYQQYICFAENGLLLNASWGSKSSRLFRYNEMSEFSRQEVSVITDYSFAPN